MERRALVEIYPLSTVSADAVESLLDAAFGVDRFSRTAYRLRAGTLPIPALGFAARSGADLLGSLQCWPVAHTAPGGTVTPLVMVGPVAVRPDLQRGGIGRLLMDHLIAAARDHADGALMMIGDPDYYGRFWQFAAEFTGDWAIPGPVDRQRLLARDAGRHRVPAAPGTIAPDPHRQP